MIERRISSRIHSDLLRKMIFLVGPRQCGKTTLALGQVQEFGGRYYNWDLDADRKLIRNSQLEAISGLWVFDELHKFSRWRNWLKGQYDAYFPDHKILVTGSARLDLYSRGGDSLQGRYLMYRLHPFTLSEVLGRTAPESLDAIPEMPAAGGQGAQEALTNLLRFGGFPEPFLSASEVEASRWRLSYGARLIHEDIRSLEQIREIDRLELLLDRLPVTIGSPISLNSLREDLEVSFDSVKNWLSIFERMYVSFRISPFGAPRIKAVKKEQKLYLWDWGVIENAGARLENLVAFHILRLSHWCEDLYGEKSELRYFRDVLGREVDFVLLRKGKPWIVVEVKSTEKNLTPGLKYFLERVKVPFAFQLCYEDGVDWVAKPINGCRTRIMSASAFLANLP